MSRDHYVEDHPAEASAHALQSIDERLLAIAGLLARLVQVMENGNHAHVWSDYDTCIVCGESR